MNLRKRQARARRKAKANRLMRWQKVPSMRFGGPFLSRALQLQ